MKRQRYSRQRQLIWDAVTARHDHPTADQLYLDVRAKDDRVSRGTVYRNLSILSEAGAITHVKTPDADRFDSRLDRHYHLLCTVCGRVFDAPVPYHAEYDAQVSQETGFRIQRHRVIFEGICPACAEHSAPND